MLNWDIAQMNDKWMLDSLRPGLIGRAGLLGQNEDICTYLRLYLGTVEKQALNSPIGSNRIEENTYLSFFWNGTRVIYTL